MNFKRPLLLCLMATVGVAGMGYGPVYGQTVYTEDGQPTALEEEIRWLLNRARFNTARENAVRQTSYRDVPASSGPVAPNERLIRSARRHTEDLARKNVFQHETVSGSLYYNASTQRHPWDRMSAEGYDWYMAAENIAAGYDTAAGVYVGWWRSAGHRHNMFNPGYCEIGNGYTYRAGTTYLDYYGMNLGQSGEAQFFTGTIFQDSNGNGRYTQGEGRSGVQVELLVRGVLRPECDVSTAVGSFAIPLQAIETDSTVQVILRNTTGASLAISVPRDYDTLEVVTLAAGESRPWGRFVKASAARNYGFRDSAPPSAYLSISPGTREHGAVAVGEATFDIDSNVNWSVQSTADWLRVRAGGAGQNVGTVSYVVDANDFGDPRRGTLVVTGDNQLVRSFEVTQQGVAAELAVASSGAEIPASGAGNEQVQVTANVTWAAVTTAHWIQFPSGAGGVGSGVLEIKVAPNSGSVGREAVVKVSGGGLERVVTIQQAAGAVRSVAEPVVLDVGEGGGVVEQVTGLAPGLSWDEVTGLVQGWPTRAGTYVLRVSVRDANGHLSKRKVTLHIDPLPGSAVGAFESRLERSLSVGAGLGGEVRMQTTSSGLVTGTLRVTGKVHPFRGRLIHERETLPRAEATVTRPGDEPIELTLHLGADHRVTGQAKVGTGTTGLEGWRKVWNSSSTRVPAGRVGRFHAVMDLTEDWSGDTGVPQGACYAVVKVTPGGGVVWNGRLADGAPVLRSGFLGPAGETGIWSALYGKQGSVRLLGALNLDGVLAGQGDWVKAGPARGPDRSYPAGFGLDERGPVALRIGGERWAPPATGQSLLEVLSLPEVPENLRLAVHDGALGETTTGKLDQTLTLRRGNRLELPRAGTPENLSRLAITVSAQTGLVSGSYQLETGSLEEPGGVIRRRATFQGLMLAKSRVAAGFSVVPKSSDSQGPAETVSGLMVLEPNAGP
jgi:uncharacterized protein YkwD